MDPRVAAAPYPFRLMPGIPGNYHLPYKGYSQPVCYKLAKSWCGKIVLKLSGQE
jgi:hypothetical protein